MFRFYSHQEIDKQLWDQCISNSPQQISYAYTWYLDEACPNWNAIILKKGTDYKAVFPLPIYKKWGVKYTSPSFFTQQLGLFGSFEKQKTAEYLNQVFKIVKEKVSWIEYSLNIHNITHIKGFQYPFEPIPTYHLPVEPEVSTVTLGNKNRNREFAKAKKLDLVMKEFFDEDFFVSWYQERKGDALTAFTSAHFETLKKIISTSLKKQKGVMYGVYDKNDELHACGYFLMSHECIHFLAGSNTEEGKKTGAMTYLMYQVCDKWNHKIKSFDFEGSRVSGVANFFKSFGSTPKWYGYVKLNNLKAPFRWLKK